MAKKPRHFTQQQWTNVIIIVISALVLLFVFIGKIMERNIDQQNVADLQVKLVRIDFGKVEIWQQGESWLSSSPEFSALQIQQVAENWQRLVNQPGQSYQHLSPGGETILLYFSNIPQPIVCKLKVDQSKLIITFVTTAQRFELSVSDKSQYTLEVN